MQVVYHTTLAHGNSLPAEGVVFGDLRDDGGCLGPGAGVVHVIGGADTEGVGVGRLAGVVIVGLLGVGQQAGPSHAAVLADLQVIRGCAGAGPIFTRPLHGGSDNGCRQISG